VCSCLSRFVAVITCRSQLQCIWVATDQSDILRATNANNTLRHQIDSIAPAPTAAAAAADYDYTQVSAPAYGPGLIHRGYRHASDEIWGDDSAGLQAVLQKFVVNATNGAITSVLFAGHSFGGGVGRLLAARTQVGWFCCIAISGIMLSV
jgi:hypothetical protein